VAWIYGRSRAGIVGSNPSNGMDACYKVEVSASGRTFVQRSPAERDVSNVCHRKARKVMP